MELTHLDFYGLHRVELRGQGDVGEKLRGTYGQFVVPDDGTPPDTIVEVTTEPPDPDVVLGGTDDHFGREGDRFVIQDGPTYFMVIDEDWGHIRTSPQNVHHHVAVLIEFDVRKRLAEEGKALVHASGVRARGETLLFPAWRSAGKTNTMLSLVADGAEYLSDDRVWAGRDGSVEEYPIPINVLARNDGMIGFDPDLTRIQRVRQALSRAILERVDMQRSVLDKLASVVAEKVIGPDVRYRLLSIEDLVPGAGHVGKSSIDRMIFLRTRPDAPDGEVSVEPVTTEDAFSALRTISYWEWNRRLGDYFAAFDMLFPGSDRRSELDALLAAEERIFHDLVENVDLYRAHIPRETDWVGTGIADQVREKLPGEPVGFESPSAGTR